MNEAAINSIKDALREMMALIVQRGEPLSEELKAKIAQVMEHAANRITQLREQGEKDLEPGIIEDEEEKIVGDIYPPEPPPQPPTGGPVPPLDKAMPSSNIHSFAYDKNSGKLYVKFQGDYPSNNGNVYEYTGIPENIFSLFKKGAVPARTDGQNKWGKWWKGKVPSIGASLYTLIKEQGYQYRKIS